jgi:hypothetical protein
LAAGLDDFVRREEIFDCMARHLGVRYLHQKARLGGPTHSIAALRRTSRQASPAIAQRVGGRPGPPRSWRQ